MGDRQRIGVYGGTFDPPHNAHLEIARAALEQAKLDRVLFVVSGVPPHKRNEVFAPAEARMRLVEAAIAGEPRMEPSRIELDREGPSYMADTLRILEEQYPGGELFLILGQDSLLDLPHWHDPEGIVKRAHLLAVPRPDADSPPPPALDGRYEMLPFAEQELSSTDIRRRIQSGESIAGLVPDAVAALIAAEGLYRAGAA